MRVVRAQLEGIDAEPGRVAAADVARIILNLERAIARAAYLVLRRPRRGTTGRHAQAIESASRLRFVGTEQGSFVELLALPETQGPSDEELPFSVADLSSMAFDRLLDAISNGASETDAELAAAVAQMAIELGIGDRNTSITLATDPEAMWTRPRRATVDATVRARMERISAQRPSTRDETLVGSLFEADFEGNTAKLRMTNGSVVSVSFTPDLADDIQEALRSRARLEGLVRYHPRTAQAVSVELRTVARSTQFALDVDAFWQSHTFAELQAGQGVTGRVTPDDLGIGDLTDDDRAAFLAALAE